MKTYDKNIFELATKEMMNFFRSSRCLHSGFKKIRLFRVCVLNRYTHMPLNGMMYCRCLFKKRMNIWTSWQQKVIIKNEVIGRWFFLSLICFFDTFNVYYFPIDFKTVCAWSIFLLVWIDFAANYFINCNFLPLIKVVTLRLYDRSANKISVWMIGRMWV